MSSRATAPLNFEVNDDKHYSTRHQVQRSTTSIKHCLLRSMADKQEPSVGVRHDQPAAVQPAVLQDPSAFQPAAEPAQWNYVLPGGVGQTFPAPVGQTFYPTIGQTFYPTIGQTFYPTIGQTLLPPGGAQPYGQPVAYYFDPGGVGLPATQAPQQLLPPTRTDIVSFLFDSRYETACFWFLVVHFLQPMSINTYLCMYVSRCLVHRSTRMTLLSTMSSLCLLRPLYAPLPLSRLSFSEYQRCFWQ